MVALHEIRAQYDQNTIVIYQAYAPGIAGPAVVHQRFVAPFSFQRMTWIKPSFLWLMHRSQWAQKANQERILAVRIKRTGWDRALKLGVLTNPEPSVYRNADQWQAEFSKAPVHIQWDPERSLRGASLNHFSIQVGISRQLILEYVEDWIVEINDITPTVVRIRDSLRAGNEGAAKRLLPVERVYPVPTELGKRILIS